MKYILFISLSSIFLSGCFIHMRQTEIKIAKRVCKEHGGIYLLKMNVISGTVVAYCKNGSDYIL